MNQWYDIIGDLHGYATKLCVLLRTLGYSICDGYFRHPERKAVFVGDFLDRGPEIKRTLEIVRGMVECGAAYAVMGNHEFNALTYHTKKNNENWIREHTEDNIRQHSETLRQLVDPYPDEWKLWLNWFSQLPLTLELDGIRVAHAAWNQASEKLVWNHLPLTTQHLIDFADCNTSRGLAREFLLSGVKIYLPKGNCVVGKSGRPRDYIRSKWWLDSGSKTYREVALPESDSVPDILIPRDLQPESRDFYDPTDIPLFIGHYWLPKEREPEPLSPNIACLDYSVAAGGPLVAYTWRGERRLKKENFLVSD